MNILIVDDHSLIREGIATMIRNVLPNARIEQADSCEGALVAARHQVFDLVFLDLMLPDQPGMVALKRLREGYPALPVVIVSGQEDKATVMKALDLGAKSFVPKSADSTKVRLAIETVLDGRIYLRFRNPQPAARPPPTSFAVARSAGIESKVDGRQWVAKRRSAQY